MSKYNLIPFQKCTLKTRGRFETIKSAYLKPQSALLKCIPPCHLVVPAPLAVGNGPDQRGQEHTTREGGIGAGYRAILKGMRQSFLMGIYLYVVSKGHFHFFSDGGNEEIRIKDEAQSFLGKHFFYLLPTTGPMMQLARCMGGGTHF